VNARSGDLTAGVDLGGTKIQTVVLRDQQAVGDARTATPQTGDPGLVVEAIVGTIHDSLEKASALPPDLRAIGVGSPGEIDTATGAVMMAANVPGFSDRVELGPMISEALAGVDVTVDNDVRVGVLGVFKRGAGRPYRNLLGVWVGTGVGGGLIIDGQLYDGRGGAGEFGHMVVRPGGRRCSCGRRGCVEAYAGRAEMEQRARHLHKRGHNTNLFEIMAQRGAQRLTSGVFDRALESGDRLAMELIEEASWAVGVGLASAQNLLDLEAIIISGGLGDRLGQPFIDRIVDHMAPHLFAPHKAPVVLGTDLGELAGAIGAAVRAGG
jgi:glucokinase